MYSSTYLQARSPTQRLRFAVREYRSIDGTREVVLNGETGYLLRPGGDKPGVEEISELLLDDDKRRAFGEAGRALVKPRFDWRTMSDILIADYEKYLEIKKKGLPVP